jgi:hypothetical protein
METEPVTWEAAESTSSEGRALSEIELQEFVRTAQNNELPPPLWLETAPERSASPSEQKRRGAAISPELWNSWFSKRDQMRTEIKRGWELLEQVQRELAVLRARLDEWAGYEVVCGKNPLSEYMQAIAAKERIEQYLPVWLKRREEQLHALDRQIEHNRVRNEAGQLS